MYSNSLNFTHVIIISLGADPGFLKGSSRAETNLCVFTSTQLLFTAWWHSL